MASTQGISHGMAKIEDLFDDPLLFIFLNK